MESAEFRTVSHAISSGMLNKLGIPVFEFYRMESAEFRTVSHAISSGILNKLGLPVFELLSHGVS